MDVEQLCTREGVGGRPTYVDCLDSTNTSLFIMRGMVSSAVAIMSMIVTRPAVVMGTMSPYLHTQR